MGYEQIAFWTETSSDPELIAGVRAGDTSAFAVLYERHADAARKVAAQYTNTPADIDDVVSESFSRVLRALQQGDGPDLAFRAYLFTIVRRTGMDLINKGIRTKPREDMSQYEAALGFEAASDEPAMEGFERGLVADAFKSLPERWQAVLWYTEVEKKSPKDIAPLLGLSANGVAALSYRAREALRQAYLQQHLSLATDVNCLEVNTQLGAYVRGGLNKRESARIDDHVAICEKCGALVAELQDVNRGMRSIIAPLVMGVLGVGALEGGLPIGGAIAGIASTAGAAGGAGAGSGAGAGGAGAGSGGAGGAGAGSGTGVGSGAGAGGGAGASGTGASTGVGTTVGAGTSGASVGGATVGAGATASAGGVGLGSAASVAGVGAAAVATTGAAPGSAVAAGAGTTGAGALAGGATTGAATTGAVTSSVGAVTAGAGAVTAGTGAAGVAVATGGVLAGAGSVLIPAAAVVGVASLAFAGAGYFGAFDAPAPAADDSAQAGEQTAPADDGAPAAGGNNEPGGSGSAQRPDNADQATPPADSGSATDPARGDGGGTGATGGTGGNGGSGTLPGDGGTGGNGGSGTLPGDGGTGGTGGNGGNGGDGGTGGTGGNGGNGGSGNLPGDGGTGGTGGNGGDGGSGETPPPPPPTSPHLTLAKAPLDFLEISESNPSVGMAIANTGDGDANDVTANITLPDGLVFAPPAGGASPHMAVPAQRLHDFVAFHSTGALTIGDWSCSFDDALATCELPSLPAGGNNSFDVPVDITGSVPDGALTHFVVTTGDQTIEYTVLTGVDVNDEDVEVIFTGEGQLAAAHVGATLMGCDQTQLACRNVMKSTASNTSGTYNNNGWAMMPLNEAGGEFNSASTTLTLPEGSVVTYASLEWAANRHTSDVFSSALDTARLRGPGQTEYTSITADTVSQTTDPDGRIYYQARKDVTDLVKDLGAGQWSLADVALSATSNDPDRTYFGGFALTVIYGNPALNDSRVAIFDGAHWVSSSKKADFTFATTAQAQVTLGWTAWEGDRGLVGDRIDIDGDTYAPMRWNGTSSSVGDSGNAADSTAFGGAYANSLGVDAKLFRPGTVPAGVHKVTVGTSGDNFLLSTLTVTIDYP